MDAAVSKGMDRILGVFGSGGKSKELFRVDPSTAYPDDEPTLPEMTRAALAVLERDPDGFFCVVEGSQIDWAGHANDIHYLLAEMLAFDEAVKTVLDWIAVEPQRRIHTLLIVVADHETGGHMVDGPYGTLSKAGEVIEDGWTSTNHSAQDTIIWSQGPGSWRLNRALDNTEVYDIIRDVL
jgi:alkaline phosphatase